MLLGLLYINYHALQTGMTDDRTLVEVQSGEASYTLRIIDAELTLDLEDYRRAEPALQKLTLFLPAQARAVTAALHALGGALEGLLDRDTA